MTTIRFIRKAVLAGSVSLTLYGCTDQPTRPGVDDSSQLSGRSVFGRLQDVPARDVDLPRSPRPWDTDDAALVAKLREEDGHAIVAFKLPTSARAAEAEGRRVALPASAFEDGLALLEQSGAEIVYVYRSFGAAWARIDPALGPELRRNHRVDYVEPRQWYQLGGTPADAAALSEMLAAASAQTTPWGISLVRAPEAWSMATGTGVKVLVIDGGINPHEDLPAIPGANCGGQYDGCSEGPNFHGTHVAGTFLARDNTIGVVGVAHGVTGDLVYSWGACNPDPPPAGCSTTQIAAGIDAGKFAAVRVINISIWSTQPDQGIADAAASADSAGIVMVSIAGNLQEGQSGGFLAYPAALSQVVGVSGVRVDKTFASTSPCGGGSNHGSHVDIAGPFWALSTVGTNGYEDEDQGWCGTSMAAPHVSGAVALLWQQNPTWSKQQILDQLFASAFHPTGGNRDDFLGHGIVDAAAALGIPPPPPPPPPQVSISGPDRIQPGATCTWEAVVTGVPPLSYSWSGEIDPTTGTEQWYTGRKNPGVIGDQFDIRVDVTDANGSGWAQITVTEDPNAQTCIMR